MSDFELYPEKPIIERSNSKNNWLLTLFSILLFIGVFLAFFADRFIFILSLVLVLFIHELGHFIGMKRFGYDNVRMLFIPMMGAFVQGNKPIYSQKESLWVILLGPYPGILLGCIGFYFGELHHMEWLATTALISLILNIINLLPLDPLDGGQLIRYLLPQHRDFFLLIFSLVSSLLVIGIGILIGDTMVSFFGFLMGFRVRAIQRKYEIRKILNQRNIPYVITYEALSNKDYHAIKTILEERQKNLSALRDHSDEKYDEVMSSYVNDLLESPIKKDVTLVGKAFLIGSWLFMLFFPLWLVLSFRF